MKILDLGQGPSGLFCFEGERIAALWHVLASVSAGGAASGYTWI